MSLKEKGLSLKRVMNNLDINSPICSCFITAYTNDKNSDLQDPTPEELEKYNEQQNNSLESDLRHLQLTGYKKIFGGYTHGTDNQIKAEPGFVVSANIKNVDPNDPEAWQYGYTQLAKDLQKGKDQGFSLTDSVELDEMNLNTLILTEEEINTITESSGMHGVPTMSMAILKMMTRKRLGLNPNFKLCENK